MNRFNMWPFKNKDYRTKELFELVKTGFNPKEKAELQFLIEDRNRAEFILEKYREATKNLIECKSCGCKILNEIRVEWCGNHY